MIFLENDFEFFLLSVEFILIFNFLENDLAYLKSIFDKITLSDKFTVLLTEIMNTHDSI